jgi:polyphosphate kinase 2 (PPK2 family)
VKFWLHISDDEQAKRFERRANDPLKQWKLTEEDWRNREKADAYVDAAEEMFLRTDHGLAPWVIVSGEQKKFARIAVVEHLIRQLEEGMHRWGMTVPDPLDD